MKKTLVIFLSVLTLVSCTANQRAKKFGGTMTVDLESNERLVNASWKNDELWLLVKKDTTKPQTYSLIEKSSWGIVEGKVIINEK